MLPPLPLLMALLLLPCAAAEGEGQGRLKLDGDVPWMWLGSVRLDGSLILATHVTQPGKHRDWICIKHKYQAQHFDASASGTGI